MIQQVLHKYALSIITAAALLVFLLFISIGSCDKNALLGASVMDAEPDEALSGGSTTVFDQTVNAFALPAPGLSGEQELQFFVGNSFFNQNWVQAPSSTEARDGLGPYFNTKSCSGCHFKDGRGQPQTVSGQLSIGMIVRLSVPGNGLHGAPAADPVYGNQFHDHAIDGVPAEGKIDLQWEESTGFYADGTTYTLRRPAAVFSELHYGEMSPDLMYSIRVAPQMIGLGLLEAIPESTILSYADPDDADGDGISGRPNYVWNSIEEKESLGRFGWKANQPTILQQIAGAFHGDMGISTKYFRDQNTEGKKEIYTALPNGGDPEISDDDLAKVHLYSETLAVPARRDVDNKDVLAGKFLFEKLGCISCHIPHMQTGSIAAFDVLKNQDIRPYTDLLLHDMGPGLADGRPDFQASGSEWRTPPLWGIGLFQTVNKHTFYLHDGRARDLSEAILWHGGEAQKARNAFVQLSKSEREQLIHFLESL